MLEARKEYKFVMKDYELNNFFIFLNNSQKTLYKNRNITSLYMDTIGFNIFHQSNLNDITKFKVRYRQYDDKGQVYLETKFNNADGKFKKKVKVNNDLSEIKNLYYKNLNLIPALVVKYTRSYFKFNNIRLTIDKNLQFLSCNNRSFSNYSHRSNLNVVEYKILDNDPDIEKYFFKIPESFSKYNYGISKVYNLNIF